MNKFNKIRKFIRQNFALLYICNLVIMLVSLAIILPLMNAIPAFSTLKSSSSGISASGWMHVLMLLTIVFWDRSGDCKCKCNKKHDEKIEDKE